MRPGERGSTSFSRLRRSVSAHIIFQFVVSLAYWHMLHSVCFMNAKTTGLGLLVGQCNICADEAVLWTYVKNVEISRSSTIAE